LEQIRPYIENTEVDATKREAERKIKCEEGLELPSPLSQLPLSRHAISTDFIFE
jgi:hypothetical protein